MRGTLPTLARSGALVLAVLLAGCSDQTVSPRSLSPNAAARHAVAPAPGTNLRLINGAYSQGSCGINTGLAFDGTSLIVSCWYYPVLDFISPADGHLVRSLTVSGANGLGALAYDAALGKLWACGDFNRVLLIDLTTGASEYKFGSPGCVDGLAYDGEDQSIWLSPDVSYTVFHYNASGALLGSFPAPLGYYGNSGIAVGGDKLYLANDGGSQIYEVAKDFSSSTLFATFPARLEDLECDDVTFANQGVGAIWSIDAYDRQINAWAIPAGKCKMGGGGGPAPCTTPPTTTVAATPSSLWPPNHKYVTITVTASAVPGCENDNIASYDGFVVSNEPDEETPVGDGHTTGDIRVTHPDGSVTLSSNATPKVPFNALTDKLEVRAERQGTAAPRIYTISFTATGASALSSTATATVTVVHNP